MRFAVILFALLFFLPLNAEAKVYSKYDSFDNSQKVYSLVYDLGFFDKSLFTKFYPRPNKPDDVTMYLLSLTKISFKEWYFFSPKGSAVKIDGEIQELSTIDVSRDYKSTSYKPEMITSVMLNLTPLADKIKTAQTVVFRIYFDNQASVDLVLPDAVLAEWKEVINTEK
jgi:hypothetical protein